MTCIDSLLAAIHAPRFGLRAEEVPDEKEIQAAVRVGDQLQGDVIHTGEARCRST